MIKSILSILFLLLFIVAQTTHSQNTFQKTFGGEEDDAFYASCILTDGGIIFAGNTKSYGQGDYDILLLKFNSALELEWSKSYGGPTEEYCFHIIPTQDNGLLFGGWTTSFGAGWRDLFVCKTDIEGNLQWTKGFGGTSGEWVKKIIETDDYYIITGTVESFGAGMRDISLTAITKSGDLVWNKAIGKGNNDNGQDLILTPDNELLIVATMYDGGNHKSTCTKTDLAGNILWNKAYSGNSTDYCRAIEMTDDGNYLISGQTLSFGAGNWDFFGLKINPTGNVLWAKTYGGSGSDIAQSLQRSGQDEFIVSGHTNSFGFGNQDIFLVNINTQDGSYLWSRTYGGAQADGPPVNVPNHMVLPASDGGFLIANYTQSFGEGNGDAYLIKTDDQGTSEVCSYYTPTPYITNPSFSTSTTTFQVESITNFQSFPFIQSNIEINENILCGCDLQISLGNDTIICLGDEINLSPGPEFINYLWQNGSTNSVFSTDTAGTYWVQVTDDQGCTASDTIEIELFPIPLVNLGPDTMICSNNGYWLDPGEGFEMYMWNNGSGNQLQFTNTEGLYWVEVWNEYGCSAIDSIHITFYPSPDISLGNDTLICEEDSLVLVVDPGYVSYLWSNGSAGTSITIDTTGIYWVEVCNEFGCCETDSIFVDFYPVAFEDLELGNDTNFCSGDVFVLNAGSGYTFYQWQDGSNDSVFYADTAGIYYVYVENPCSSSSDTIVLDVFPPTSIDLGNDTVVCYGENILLDPGFGFLSYIWQDGSTNPVYYTNQSGMYWVDVTDTNNCNVSDTISLEFILPDPGLGNDTSICLGDSIVFSTHDGFVSCLWQNGSSLPYLVTGSPGQYWCEVVDSLGCIGSDTVTLELMYLPDIKLGNDTVFCEGDSILFNLSIDHSNTFHWQDGSTDTSYTIVQEGIYWVQATNNCGSSSDSVYIAEWSLPQVFLGNDTVLATNDEILLNAGSFESYLWSNGSEQQILTIDSDGIYWVNVFDGKCYNSDTIVIEPVNCDLFIPNVFTPNGDGANDYFQTIVSKDIYDFQLLVFNRWGETIWETNYKYDFWDGTRKGFPAAEGTYFWLVNYKCSGALQLFERKGTVYLLR